MSVILGVLILINVPFQVTDKKSKPYIQVDIGGGQMKTFAPEEISAMVLTKMKETAEAYLGKKVKKKKPIEEYTSKDIPLLNKQRITESNVFILSSGYTCCGHCSCLLQ